MKWFTAHNLVLAIVALAMAAVGCGSSSSPTGPSGQATPGTLLPLSESAYVIEFHGDSLQCRDDKIPQAGTVVANTVMMRRDGAAWTAVNGAGTLTLRLESATETSVFGSRITGNARGSADDEGVLFDPRFSTPPNGTRLAIADAVPLSGVIPTGAAASFAQGTLDGPVAFSRAGVTSACPAGSVTWTMSRLP